jgi:DNA-binding MarR family transcriptional regulator
VASAPETPSGRVTARITSTVGAPNDPYAGTVTPDEAAGPEAVDPLALERQVCFALSVAARNVVAVYRPWLGPMGLTHPQYLVMLALWQHGPLANKDLSHLLQLDPGTLSPLVKRLEAAGLVRRDRDPRDERTLAIALTDEGWALRARAERIPTGIVERLGMPLDELQALHGALTRVISAAQAAADHEVSDLTA